MEKIAIAMLGTSTILTLSYIATLLYLFRLYSKGLSEAMRHVSMAHGNIAAAMAHEPAFTEDGFSTEEQPREQNEFDTKKEALLRDFPELEEEVREIEARLKFNPKKPGLAEGMYGGSR